MVDDVSLTVPGRAAPRRGAARAPAVPGTALWADRARHDGVGDHH